MTPAQVAHIMALVEEYAGDYARATTENLYGTSKSYTKQCFEAANEARAAVEAALRDAPQAEIDAITELNHAQWLALENVRHLAARNRNEEWAQHMLRWCTEAGNAARILRSTSSAPQAEPPNAATTESANFAGAIAYQLTKRLVIDMPTARSIIDDAIRATKGDKL